MHSTGKQRQNDHDDDRAPDDTPGKSGTLLTMLKTPAYFLPTVEISDMDHNHTQPFDKRIVS